MDLPFAFTPEQFATLLGNALWIGAAIGSFLVVMTLFYGSDS